MTIVNLTNCCNCVFISFIFRPDRGQVPPDTKSRLFSFELRASLLDETAILAHLEHGRYFLATVAMDDGRYEEASALFERVSNPEAAFFQAQVR